MMLKVAKLGIAMAVLAMLIVPAAYAGVPDVNRSYYVPQSGSVTTPTEGAGAIANARRCPNDDGTQVLRLNARLKVVVLASDGSPIAGIPASDICVLFNGGTPAQGFSGVGDDSIIANFQFNQLSNCPDVRCVPADAPTDASGVAYITWIGAIPGQPGVGQYTPPDLGIAHEESIFEYTKDRRPDLLTSAAISDKPTGWDAPHEPFHSLH